MCRELDLISPSGTGLYLLCNISDTCKTYDIINTLMVLVQLYHHSFNLILKDTLTTTFKKRLLFSYCNPNIKCICLYVEI